MCTERPNEEQVATRVPHNPSERCFVLSNERWRCSSGAPAASQHYKQYGRIDRTMSLWNEARDDPASTKKVSSGPIPTSLSVRRRCHRMNAAENYNTSWSALAVPPWSGGPAIAANCRPRSQPACRCGSLPNGCRGEARLACNSCMILPQSLSLDRLEPA